MHDTFMTLFLIGAFGLVAQMFIGRLHFGHVSHHVTHVAHAGHGLAHQNHAVKTSNQPNSNSKEGAGFWLIGLLSPMMVFSVCLGIGAGGLILLQYLKTPWLVSTIALLIGIAFYAFAVEPISRLVFAFASKPALALDGAIASEAEAVSSFNEAGDGVVLLNVDGQTTRILAHLDKSEETPPSAIRVGDKLVVIDIDGKSNTCKVAKL